MTTVRSGHGHAPHASTESVPSRMRCVRALVVTICGRWKRLALVRNNTSPSRARNSDTEFSSKCFFWWRRGGFAAPPVNCWPVMMLKPFCCSHRHQDKPAVRARTSSVCYGDAEHAPCRVCSGTAGAHRWTLAALPRGLPRCACGLGPDRCHEHYDAGNLHTHGRVTRRSGLPPSRETYPYGTVWYACHVWASTARRGRPGGTPRTGIRAPRPRFSCQN